MVNLSAPLTAQQLRSSAGRRGRGDTPVEDWSSNSPEQSIPFERDLINRQPAALTASGPGSARR